MNISSSVKNLSDSSDDFLLFSKKKKSQQAEPLPENILQAERSFTAQSACKNANLMTPEKNTVIPTSSTFSFLSPWLIEILKSLRINSPTEIQTASIPAILNGANFLGSAPTGSGKTASFALPIIQRLCENPYGTFALVITPTRELAFQISEQFNVFGSAMSIRVATVVGGMDIIDQQLQLSKRPHIIVCTPGRLLDIYRSSSDCLALSKLAFIVLDEADRLLEGTLLKETKEIMQIIPETVQKLLFSATFHLDLSRYDWLSLGDYKQYHMMQKGRAKFRCSQQYLLIPSRVKDCYLMYLLGDWLKSQASIRNVIVFVGTCRTAECIYRMMQRLLDSSAVPLARLHSQMSQKERLESIRLFRSCKARVLICTDVASRGLDIPEVDFVINMDIPNSSRDYVHRVGRCGRSEKEGIALSLVTEHDIDLIQSIESAIAVQLDELSQNSSEENAIKESAVLKGLNKTAEARKICEIYMESEEWGKKRKINKQKASRD